VRHSAIRHHIIIIVVIAFVINRHCHHHYLHHPGADPEVTSEERREQRQTCLPVRKLNTFCTSQANFVCNFAHKRSEYAVKSVGLQHLQTPAWA